MLQVVAGTVVDIPYTAVQPDGTAGVAATATIQRLDTDEYWDADAGDWNELLTTNDMAAGQSSGNFWLAWTVDATLPRGTRVRIECAATDCIPIAHSLTILGALLAQSDDEAELSTDSLEAIDTQLSATHGEGSWDELSSESLEAIDSQLSSTHGAGSWLTPSAGDGAFATELTVQDDSGEPIAGAKVRFQVAGGTATQITDSSGKVTFHWDAGTWIGTIGTTASYIPSSSYTVVVDAEGNLTSPAGGILQVSRVAVPIPTEPDTYLLYSYERRADYADTLFGAAGVTIKLVDFELRGRVDSAAASLRSLVGQEYSTDANGLWTLEIAQSAVATGCWIVLLRSWLDADGVEVTESLKVKLSAAEVDDFDRLALADLEIMEYTLVE